MIQCHPSLASHFLSLGVKVIKLTSEILGCQSFNIFYPPSSLCSYQWAISLLFGGLGGGGYLFKDSLIEFRSVFNQFLVQSRNEERMAHKAAIPEFVNH